MASVDFYRLRISVDFGRDSFFLSLCWCKLWTFVRASANRDNGINIYDNQIMITSALIVCIDMAFQQLLKLHINPLQNVILWIS